MYLKSPVSKAMRLVNAAISAGDVMPYVPNEELIATAAWSAVRHSFGLGAPAQVEEAGAMDRICSPDTAARWAPAACETDKERSGTTTARRLWGTMVEISGGYLKRI